jgi:hypothetical protein
VTSEELDTIYREASWLIAKRSGVTAVKALTVGNESLERTITEIAEMYALTPSERRVLRPSIADEVQKGASTAVNAAKSLAGAAKVSTDGAQIAKAAGSAWKAGRIGKSLVTAVTHGPKAAQTFANTGRVVSKANPWVLGLTVMWTVSSTGWFAYHARGFNKAAYELKKKQVGKGAIEGPPATLSSA